MEKEITCNCCGKKTGINFYFWEKEILCYHCYNDYEEKEFQERNKTCSSMKYRG